MDGAERDSTEDWLISPGRTPPRLVELEQRVAQAVALARASEKGVELVGQAALDAAEQAHRAAGLAEAASIAALAASRAARTAGVPDRFGNGSGGDPRLRHFHEHADRVEARLMALRRRPDGVSTTPLQRR